MSCLRLAPRRSEPQPAKDLLESSGQVPQRPLTITFEPRPMHDGQPLEFSIRASSRSSDEGGGVMIRRVLGIYPDGRGKRAVLNRFPAAYGVHLRKIRKKRGAYG